LEYLCSVCGKRISPRFWVCASCRGAHDLNRPYREWPQWAKAAREDERARRKDELQYSDHEEQQEDVDEVWKLLAPNEGDQFYEWTQAPPDDRVSHLRTRLDHDAVTRMPYGPYPTEPENRAYRAANGIPERA